MEDRPTIMTMSDLSIEDLEAQRSLRTGKSSTEGQGIFKQRLGRFNTDIKHLNGRQRPELSDGLFWYHEFGTGFSCQPSRKASFGECTKSLREALHSSPGQKTSLQLFVLSTSPLSRDIYTWPTQLFAIIRGHLETIVTLPRYVIATEIESAWTALSDCTYKSIEYPNQLLNVEQLSLPEYRRQFLSHSDEECACKTCVVRDITSEYDERPRNPEPWLWSEKLKRLQNCAPRVLSVDLPSKATENIFPAQRAQTSQCARIFDRRTASFSFVWQRSAPTFRGGFDTFLWERYSKPPPCDYAEVFYQDDETITGPRRVFMTVSTTPEWVGTTSLLHDVKTKSEGLWALLHEKQGGDLLPMLVVISQVTADTTVFLQRAVEELTKMKYSGRSGASVQKIQYLCHLQDCRESAWYGVEQVRSLIRDLLSIIEARGVEQGGMFAEVAFFQEKEVDLAYLAGKLVGLKKLVDDMCEVIKGHRELSQTRQMSLLTYIATIWVPLSFVTGMLGMNVSSPLNLFHHSADRESNPSTASTTTSLIARALSNTSNSTDTTNTTYQDSILNSLSSLNQTETGILNNPNPYIWRFGFFVTLAGILFVLSVILPLIGPNLLRIAVQRLYRLRNWWVFWPIVFFSYYATVYWVIPAIILAVLKCDSNQGGCSDEGWNEYYYIYNFAEAGWNNINTISYVISAVVMGVIGLANLSLSVMYRRGGIDMCVWLGFAVVVIASYTVDYYASVESRYPYPIGTALSLSAILPLLYLVGVWVAPLIMRWLAKRRERRLSPKKNN